MFTLWCFPKDACCAAFQSVPVEVLSSGFLLRGVPIEYTCAVFQQVRFVKFSERTTLWYWLKASRCEAFQSNPCVAFSKGFLF